MVKGRAKVTKGSDVFYLEEGGSTFVPKKTIHSYFFTNMGDTYVLPPSSAEYASVAELITEKFVDKYGKYVDPHMVWDSI